MDALARLWQQSHRYWSKWTVYQSRTLHPSSLLFLLSPDAEGSDPRSLGELQLDDVVWLVRLKKSVHGWWAWRVTSVCRSVARNELQTVSQVQRFLFFFLPFIFTSSIDEEVDVVDLSVDAASAHTDQFTLCNSVLGLASDTCTLVVVEGDGTARRNCQPRCCARHAAQRELRHWTLQVLL